MYVRVCVFARGAGRLWCVWRVENKPKVEGQREGEVTKAKQTVVEVTRLCLKHSANHTIIFVLVCCLRVTGKAARRRKKAAAAQQQQAAVAASSRSNMVRLPDGSLYR